MEASLQDHLKIGENQDSVRADVQTYYGSTLKATTDLKTSACCTSKPPPKEVVEVLRRVPEEIRSRYYGCGSPFPQGIQGRRILDLGCGTGRDCYVCAALVGEKGHVTGVDMTPAQLSLAQQYVDAWTAELGYAQPNMTFVQGQIEKLAEAGVAPGSIDVAISNCVINLSPDKAACLRGVYEALAPGGEMYFSDVYCDRRLPQAARSHPVLLGECLGGALYFNDFVALAAAVGFAAPRIVEAEEVSVQDGELSALLDGARFASVTVRLFKLPGPIDELPEDYGQTATYKGSIPGLPESYTLDNGYALPAGAAVPVDGNTALVLQQSWLASHFEVTPRGEHRGMWRGSGSGAVTVALLEAAVAAQSLGSSCCAPAAKAASNGGSCCAPAAKAPAAAPAVKRCCGPATAAAPANGCSPGPAAKGRCGPAGATAAANGSSAAPAAGAANGCCGPAAAMTGCCSPTAAAQTVDQAPTQKACGSGSCC